MSEKHVAPTQPAELEEAIRMLIGASTMFILALRRAHHQDQPAEAAAYSVMARHGGQHALRVELGLAPHIEAGVVHDGAFKRYFLWQAPAADAPDLSKAN